MKTNIITILKNKGQQQFKSQQLIITKGKLKGKGLLLRETNEVTGTPLKGLFMLVLCPLDKEGLMISDLKHIPNPLHTFERGFVKPTAHPCPHFPGTSCCCLCCSSCHSYLQCLCWFGMGAGCPAAQGFFTEALSTST